MNKDAPRAAGTYILESPKANHRIFLCVLQMMREIGAQDVLSLWKNSRYHYPIPCPLVTPTPSRRGNPFALGASRPELRSLQHSAPISPRKPMNFFKSSAIAAGWVVCLVLGMWWFSRTEAVAASTVGRGAQVGRLSGSSALNLNVVDKAFYSFTETLDTLLSDQKVTSSPIKEYLVMFNTAWVTTSTAPIAAAGVLGQPLGRAMLATVSSHAIFAISKFTMAYGAITAGSNASWKSGTPSRRATPPTPRASIKRSRVFPPINRRKQPPRLPPAGAVSGRDTAVRHNMMYVRRSAKTVPRLWLTAITAFGGPGLGTVAALTSHRFGLISIPAVWSSLLRGSALETLISASLCYVGAGTRLAARWAVIQGIFGVFIAVILSLEVILAVSLTNTLTAAGRRSLNSGNGGRVPRGKPKEREDGKGDREDKS